MFVFPNYNAFPIFPLAKKRKQQLAYSTFLLQLRPTFAEGNTRIFILLKSTHLIRGTVRMLSWWPSTTARPQLCRAGRYGG